MLSKGFLATLLFFLAFVHFLHGESSEVLGEDLNKVTSHEKIDCGAACSARCRLSSRPRLCHRACGTCCARCNCVPPGTSGNKDVCPCYANMKTHGNKPKCP